MSCMPSDVRTYSTVDRAIFTEEIRGHIINTNSCRALIEDLKYHIYRNHLPFMVVHHAYKGHLQGQNEPLDRHSLRNLEVLCPLAVRKWILMHHCANFLAYILAY